MSERIRELWKQTAVRDDSTHPWTYDQDLHVKKFAELIVKECIDKMYIAMESTDNTDLAYNAMLTAIIADIQESFEIKESKVEKFSRDMRKAFKKGVDLSGKETP